MDQLTILHLPNLQIDEHNFEHISYRLLPRTISHMLKEYNIIGSNLLFVVSGDVVSYPTKRNFERAYQVLKHCYDVCSTRTIIMVPGDQDIFKASLHDRFLIRKLRADFKQELPAQQLLSRRRLYDKLINKMGGHDFEMYDLPIVFLRNKFGSWTVNTVALDSSLFSLSEERDRQNLIIGANKLLNFLKDQLSGDMNIAVLHHSINWLAYSQTEIVEFLLNRCHMFLFSHPPFEKTQRDSAGSIDTLGITSRIVNPLHLGPIVGNKEFQIIQVHPTMQQTMILFFYWNDDRLDWVRLDKQKVSLMLNDKQTGESDMNQFMDIDGNNRIVLMKFLLDAGRFAMSELKQKWHARRQEDQGQSAEFVNISEFDESADKQKLQMWLNRLSTNRLLECQTEIENKLELIQEEKKVRTSDQKALRRQEMSRAAFELREADRIKEIDNAMRDIEHIMNECLGLDVKRIPL